MSYSFLPPNITASVNISSAPAEVVPLEIHEYLRDMGFSSQYHEGKYYFSRVDKQGSWVYMSWSEAVAYCLIKPFLGETK
jgi:hypothetical protein